MNIGLGTAAIGRPQYINIRSESNTSPFDKLQFIENGKKLLCNAYSKGIRHFDTAPGYGIAEQILLEWLNETDYNDITISTKWGYTYVANFDPKATTHEVKEHSLEKLNEQWEYSKQFLPYLNIYQIHSATLDSGVLNNKAVHNRLHEIKKTHNIEIGLSTSGANQNEIIEAALSVSLDDEALFDSFQVTYNAFDQSLAEIKGKLDDKKVIIKEALANGRIFPNAAYSNYNKAYEQMSELAKKHNVGIDAIALRFCIDSINSYNVLSGASKESQLTSNLQAEQFKLSPQDLDLLSQLAVDPKDYWLERKKLAWN